MKQSLLDSFVKKLPKKTDQPAKNQQNQNKSGQNADRQSKVLNKRRTTNIDSDQQYQQQQQVVLQKQFNDLEFKEQNQGNRRPRGKSRGKSKQKNQKAKAIMKTNEKNQNNNEAADESSFLQQFTEATPIWAQKQHCKDSLQRSSNDPNYDPTTLYVPPDAWVKFTAPMKQFWKIKSQNFQKIILFKLGKFYELFYDDAYVGNRYLDLKFMGTKMHTGFPQKCLDKYVKQLVDLGYKTVVVEQMQTPQQMQQRVACQKKQGRKSEKTLNRQITQILTKGTYIKKDNQEDQVYLPNYLLSLRGFGQNFGFSLLQISTNQILMGVVSSIDKLKTMLYQTRPSQIIYDPDNLSFQVTRMMQKTFLSMQMSKIMNKNNLWHPLNSIGDMERLEHQNKFRKPKIFQVIDQLPELNKNLIYATISGLFSYLKQILKFQYVIDTVRFNFFQKDSYCKNLILDSQALQHLEIFQTSEGPQDSLFNKMDKTKTKFGKRLLRKWVMSPLMNEYHINQRLDAIDDFYKIMLEKQNIGKILKKLPDLDKKINKLYHYAIKNTSASKAIYFQDVSTARLKQFRQTMQRLQQSWQIIEILQKQKQRFDSKRLLQLITLDQQTKINQNQNQIFAEDEESQLKYKGLLPDIISHLNEFKAYVKWDGNTPIPQKGLVPSFDALQDQMEKIKNQLQKYLDKLRYQMNEANLKFVHIKQRYQIQIPQKSEKRRPNNFQYSSKRAGFSRYISPDIKQNIKFLQKVQSDIKQQMGLFIGFFFEQFKKKQKIWQKYVQVISQIDCLISIAEYSHIGNKVRPHFTSNKFEIRGACHPSLESIQFIPNDIILKPKVILLTGPNMGGKSTVLRTACLLAVLAQIGCYVSAESYDCQIVDRIFTRIGASDKLQLGKSTFFIQLQQTKCILQHGTSRSLAIIDQLGRGTSTFDGLALAFSVLNDLIYKVKCYCLFATHYHILVDEFMLNPEVQLMKMDSLTQKDKIFFLYKLVPGYVDKSFGLYIARRVGIKQQTIKIAEIQARKMNNHIEKKKNLSFSRVVKFLQQTKQLYQ